MSSSEIKSSCGTTSLPEDIWNIIEDYYYSHRQFCLKQRLARELKHLHMLQEVRIFYEIYYSPVTPFPNSVWPHHYTGPFALGHPLPLL